MIDKYQIPDDSRNGEYTFYRTFDFEYADPSKQMAESFIALDISLMRDFILANNPNIPLDHVEKLVHNKAIKDWRQKLKAIKETIVPDNLVQILKSTSKNEQVKLLKGLSITSDILQAFIYNAGTDYGYTLSQYTAEHQQKGLDQSKMPIVTEIKDNTVHKVGKTELSDGQLKQAVDHRKRIISKILDKKNTWHCFFVTYDSLKGKESWKDGQAHYHYISDKFGIPREEVVSELKNQKYKLGNLPHIDILDYPH